VVERDGAFCARCGEGFVTLRAINGLTRQTKGPFIGYELLSPRRENGWLIRVENNRESSFEEFIDRCAGAEITRSGDALMYEYEGHTLVSHY
jgi:hypothetical protein